jgi:hypothetical protein
MKMLILTEYGRVVDEISLPSIPQRGDVLSSTDPKSPVYLVLRVEYVADNSAVNLHVRKFANQLAAVNDIDGFRNDRQRS